MFDLILSSAKAIIMSPLSIIYMKSDPHALKKIISTTRHITDRFGPNFSSAYGGPSSSGKITIQAISRIALAIIGTFAQYKIGGSMIIGAAIGAFLSLPAVAFAGGKWLVYHGITTVIAGLAASSFTTLGHGAALIYGGGL
jgi:hypothetical protein